MATILDDLRDLQLFGPWFDGPSWHAWRVFLGAIFGLSIDGSDAALYTKCTRRSTPPAAAAREAWVIVGRRGGKSRIAALIAVHRACFRDYHQVLAPGEVGTLPVIAADRRQARTILRYINGFFDAVPLLGRMVVNRTKETIELSNRVVIEVHTASWRTLRGYTVVAAVCDEIAFWRSDESSANPDSEILAALRPGMASVPGALLLAISSPYARRGALWDAYRRHHGQDGDPVLVWQAPTAVMNPDVDPQVIADAYTEDESAAAAEYGAEFRKDIEAFIPREVVESCVIPDRLELPPVSDVRYAGFVDPSGGSQDAMTIAIAHSERDRVVLDAVRERRPPFSPADVVREFVELGKTYRLTRVTGDRYGGEWPRERFREHGVDYAAAEMPRSDLYRELLPLLNSGQAELLDDKRLVTQLCALERRTARSGRDSIDHGPGAHDDVANAAAGAIVTAKRKVRKRIIAR